MNLLVKTILLSSLMVVSVINGIQASNVAIEPAKFAKLASISNLTLSPNGERLALIRRSTAEPNGLIEIYNTANLAEAPFRMNSENMSIQFVEWVSNDDLIMFAQQQVRDDIEGFNRGTFETRLAKIDLVKKNVREFRGRFSGVVNTLPKDPNKILVSGRDSDVARVLSYYKLDLRSGKRQLVLRGSLEYRGVRFDADGNPIFSSYFDVKERKIRYYVREPGSDDWEEVYTQSVESFENFRIVGFDPEKKTNLFVVANNGEDTQGFWSYNYKDKKFEELIYRRQDVDVRGARNHSNSVKYPDTVVGITYASDKIHTEFFDGGEQALYEQLEDLIPYAHQISVERSADDKVFLVQNRGPQDPGTYYLIREGKIQKVGVTQPELEYDKLSKMEYIEYKSRHGDNLYAYVTIPQGEPPFPAVVLPHGGPFVGELIIFDEWSQLLANHGYLVIQPQYRGSRNYGIEYYTKAFLPKGRGGYEMQDDKDDSALHLVKEGLVDKDRIAMFGWSYGGYAALIAASREDQIYQCAVAGAAVADNKQQLDYYRDRLLDGAASSIEQMNFWSDSISPIEQVSKVNIPLFMVHGTVDQRVPLEHAEKYLAAAREAGVNVKYTALEKADHFLNTLNEGHLRQFYTELIDYLKNDCGPGGL